MSDERPAPSWKRRVVRIAPYVIAISVIAVILSKYSARQIAEEMARGDVRFLLPIAAVNFIISLLLVSWADAIVIRHSGFTAARYFDVVRAKAGSTLLNIIGYAAGHGGYGVWIARFAGRSETPRAMEAASTVLYIVASELFSVCAIASISVYGFGVDVPAAIAWSAPVIALLLVVFVLIGPHGPLSARFRIFAAWRIVPRTFGLMQMGVRAIQITMVVLGTWLAAVAFGLNIPLAAMLAYFPVVMLVTSLPVNVAGFGAAQGAWLLFLPYEPAPRILAFQVLWGLTVLLVIFLRGLPFVKRVIREAAA